MGKEERRSGYRIAVATTDGEHVDQCFGHAEHFYIIEVDEKGEYDIIEDRAANPFCMGGYHRIESLTGAAEGISDCTYILAARAGDPAVQVMREKGLTLLRCPGTIEDGIRSVQNLRLQEEPYVANIDSAL